MTEALIIGGGLAGGALAAYLAQAGRDVMLVEREAHAHDKVCGEFLSHEAASYLNRLGIDLPALGAVPIRAVRLYRYARQGESALPFAAWSLSRRILDEVVLAKAAEAGAEIRRGVRVSELIPLAPIGGEGGVRGKDKGWQAHIGNETVTASSAFLCTGKHDLRGYKRPKGLQSDLVGFKMHWRLDPLQQAKLGHRVDLMLFPGGYAGLQPIEAGLANLCLLIRRRRLEAIGSTWSDLLAFLNETSPPLAERLTGAVALWEKPLAIASIPYGYVRHRSDGVWRLGDQAAVIPSFAGDGMSIALHSAYRAAEAFLAGRTAEQYQPALADELRWQIWRATALSHLLVRAWGQSMVGAVASAPAMLRLTATATRVREVA